MTLRTDEVVDGRYRVVKLLGKGGMGAVYRAWDTRLNRPVALKEMVPQTGLNREMLEQLREQFRQEAQILATLTHPNLVRVTDYLSWEENEYLVMDFVEGESLANLIHREGALPEDQVLDWTRQLLNALVYCHSRNIIHRDIKPQNIIITPEGRAVLVDFGLVKLWDPNDPLTRTVMRGAGTPEYAPPEQYDTDLSHTDPRSDIYSLGATLYHALTGHVPPTATQRMASPYYFTPPRQANPSISPATEQIILKSLEIAMDARFQSAEEMAKEVDAAIASLSGEVERSPSSGETAVLPPTTEQPPVESPSDGGTLVLPGSAPQPEPVEAVAGEQEEKRRFLGLSWLGLGLIGCGLCLGLGFVLAGIGLFLSAGEDGGKVAPTFPPATVVRVTPSPVPPTTAAAQPTSAPIASPVPATGSDVLLEDDFSNSGSGWEVGDYDTGSVGYKDGTYFVISNEQNKVMWGVAKEVWDNMVIEVDATPIRSPDSNNNGYGVACRVQDNGDGYFFFISGDGYYSISRVKDGSFARLVDWTGSSAIHQGKIPNHLRVVCDGPMLVLFVNGQQVASARDDMFRSGGVAMTAVTYEEQPVEVHFDNVRVLRPPTGGPQGEVTPPTASVIFQDDFSNSGSGWEVGDYDNGSVGYKDGVYFVISSGKGSTMWGVARQDFSDLVLTVDATQVRAPANDNNDYGVICREQGDGNGYYFLISGDGYYSLAKAVSGEFTWLVEWTESPVVNKENATNHLRVICDGDSLVFFVNGEKVAEESDGTYSRGDIALTATTYEDEPTEIHFDNLIVTRPMR